MKYRFLLPITALFTMTLLVSNTLDTKIFTAFGLNLPAGIILFPLAYLAGDLLTEVYGYAVTRRVIWSGLAALLIMIGAYEIARHLPAASFWTGQAAFESIFSHVPRIVAASIVAFLCGEFINALVVARMKVMTGGRWMAARFAASTVAGQLVDTSIFVAIAYFGVFANSELLPIILSGWLVKVAWEIVALPLTILIAKTLKRVEGEDHYDSSTNFNPFRI